MINIKNLVIIIVFFVFIYYFPFEANTTEQFRLVDNIVNIVNIVNTDRIVWTYWENTDGKKEYPSHIKLCFETFKKHLSKYKVIILNNKSIHTYLPNVRTDLDDLLIAQKVDYYRIALLEKYGGIWVDADSIIMKNFDEIFNKIDEGYDFVGFGCTGQICMNGKFRPSNWLMGSKKNGLLMKNTLNLLNIKLNNKTKNYEYHDLGKNVIWNALDLLQKDNYDYYHFSSEYDGSRDINGYWIDSNKHFSKDNIQLINNDKLIVVFLTNSGINQYHKWVNTASRNELLFGEYWISQYFRKSLLTN